jgi:phage FluMu protein Com
MELRCKECNRHLGLKSIYTIISQVRCPNSKCKLLNNVKVVNSQSTEAQIRYRFEVENG